MRKIMPADYAWEDDWPEEIYTVTFVRGLDERETLRRFGVTDDNVHPVDDEEVMERIEETDGCCDMVLVTRAGDWTIAFEYSGWEGTRPETLRELTRDGGEAVSVMRHNYAASHDFEHAADGRIRTAFRPQTPQERWGSHPDALNEDMRELGLEPEPDEEFQYLSGSVPAALALASRISGVLFTPAALLDGPLLGGVITDAVPDDPREGDPLARHALRAFNRELAEAIDNASPDLQRWAAVAEARRQCELAGVAGHDLARKICHGRKGELYHRYERSLENQLGVLGLVLNCVALWTTVYLDAAVRQFRPRDTRSETRTWPGSARSCASTSGYTAPTTSSCRIWPRRHPRPARPHDDEE